MKTTPHIIPHDPRDDEPLSDEECAMLNYGPAYVASYSKLHAMLADMIEGGRLSEADLPDDFLALVNQLGGPCCAAAARLPMAYTREDVT